MQNIIEHIETLLLKHDCVIVPNFGGFIANQELAHIVADKNLFVPTAKKIGFNVQLTYNDGLLAQSIMQTDFLSYEQAMKLITQEVQTISDALKTNRKVALGKVGTLLLNELNTIVFEPNDSFVVSPENYGLTSFSFAPLNNKIEVDFSTQVSAKKVSFSKYILIAAAAILFFFFLPTNLSDKAHSRTDQAALLSLNFDRIPAVEKKVDSVVTTPSTSSTDSLTLAVKENQHPIVKEKKTIIKQQIETTNQNNACTYHIIIASLPNKELAEKYLQEMNDFSADSVSIVQQDGRHRVSVKNFTNKSDADAYLKKFRSENPRFSSAWVLKGSNS